jgi:HlyD family secretion protein
MKNVGSYAVCKATKALGQYDLKTFEVKMRPEAQNLQLAAGMSAIIK